MPEFGIMVNFWLGGTNWLLAQVLTLLESKHQNNFLRTFSSLKSIFYFFPSLRFLIFNSSTNTLIRQISHHPLVISRSNHHFPVNILNLLSFS